MSSSKYEQMGGMVHDNGFYRLGGRVNSATNDQYQYQQQLNNNHQQYDQQQQQFYTNNAQQLTNGVDHYMVSGYGGYYPDSDLETIAEESSVIESEISTRNSSGGGKVMTSDGNESDSTLSEFSSIEHSRRSSKEELRSSITSSDASSTGRSIRGGYQHNNKQQQRVTPLAEQKIVFAKCLPGHRESSRDKNTVAAPAVNNDPPPIDMFEAAKAGNFNALSRFSADELSSTLDEKGNTLMHVAAENGQLDCVQRLVSIFNPSMVLLPNDDILTATGLAIKNGHTKCAQWMLENTPAKEELIMSRLASNIDGFNTRDPVAHIAARYDREELLDWICEEMVRDDISVDTSNHTSDAAIHIAARYGNIKCVQALVARGASVTILNSLGETPAQAAQKAGHSVCVGYLVVVETCVSLAQQVVSLKNDLESLQNRYDDMERSSKTSGSTTNGNNGKIDLIGSKKVELPMNGIVTKPTTTAAPVTRTNEQPIVRRTLQQQPPPPKIWLSDKSNSDNNSTQQENNKNNRLNKKHSHQQQATAKTAAHNGAKPPQVLEDNEKQQQLEQQGNNNNNNKEVVDDSADEIADLTKGLTTAKKPWENLTIDEILKMVREIRYQPSPSVSHFTEDSQMESVEVMKDRLAAASRWFLVDQGKGKFSNGLNNNMNSRRRRQPDSHYQVFTPNMAPKKQQQQHPKQQQHGMTNLDKQQQQMQKQQTQQQQRGATEHRHKPLQTNGTSNNNNNLKLHTKSQVFNPPLTNKTNNTQQRSNSNGKSATNRTKSPESKKGSTENFQTHQHALLVTKSTSSNHTSSTGLSNSTTQHKRAMFERTADPSSQTSAAVKFGSDKRKGDNFTSDTTQVYKKGMKENGDDTSVVGNNKHQQGYGKPRNAPNSARQLNASTQRSGSYRRAVWSAPYLRNEPSSAEQRLNQKNLAAENHRFHQQQQQHTTSPLATSDKNDELRERLSPPSDVEEKGKVGGGGGGKSVGMWTKPGVVNGGTIPNHTAGNNHTTTTTSNNKTVTATTTDNSNQQRGKTKGYNWVNSYFRNRSSSSSSTSTGNVQQQSTQQQQEANHHHTEDDVAPEPSEVPELRNEMAPRQSSFLRKVQGKRKQKM